jgi:hypothetical protein
MVEQRDVKALRATDLLDMEFPEHNSYIEPNILTKGGTLLLGGLAKIGKSLMMLEVIRAAANCKPLFDYPAFEVPESVRCLYIEAENGLRATRERAKKIFENEERKIWEDNFYLVSSEPLLLLDSNWGIRNFTSLLKDVRPNILLLDPISLLHNGEENSNVDIGRLYSTLNKLKILGKEFDMAVVLAHHFGKPPYGEHRSGFDPLSEYNFRGASKWKDGADSIITAHRYSNIGGKPYEAWKLKLRFTTRHGSPPPEMTVLVNRDDDLRMVAGDRRPIVQVNVPPPSQDPLAFPEVPLKIGEWKYDKWAVGKEVVYG